MILSLKVVLRQIWWKSTLIDKENYPSVFLYTSANDDVVHPSHTNKFGAKLQKNQQNGKNTIIIKTYTDSGHLYYDNDQRTEGLVNKLLFAWNYLRE